MAQQTVPTTEAAGKSFAGYTHVNILVDDLEAAREFYGDKLGLEQLDRPSFGGMGGWWFRVGAVQLHIGCVKEMPDLKGSTPHFAIYVPTDVFESTVGAMVESGVELTMPIRTHEDFGVAVKTAFCKDPAGNLIELTDVPPF